MQTSLRNSFFLLSNSNCQYSRRWLVGYKNALESLCETGGSAFLGKRSGSTVHPQHDESVPHHTASQQSGTTKYVHEINVNIEGTPLLHTTENLLEFRKRIKLDARKALKLALKQKVSTTPGFEHPRHSCVDIVLADDRRVTELNKRYLDHDYATDVLTFPNSEAWDNPELPVTILGDVVISLDTAREQAREKGHGLLDETRVLLVHGLLHLMGLDHERGAEDHARMAQREHDLLKKLAWQGRGLVHDADVAERRDLTAAPLKTGRKPKRREPPAAVDGDKKEQ